MQIVTQVSPGNWHPVLTFDDNRCVISGRAFSFEQLWGGAGQDAPADNAAQPVMWPQLLPPLPLPDVTCIAFGFTYNSHRREMRYDGLLRFWKKTRAVQMNTSVA